MLSDTVDSRSQSLSVCESNPLIGVTTMFGNEPVADKALLKKINQRLERTGLGSRSRVTVTIRRGQVSLSGNIQYEHQRRPALKAVGSLQGVRGVVDHLQVQSRDAYRR